MDFTDEQKAFIIDYAKCLKDGCASVFIGAGLSRPSGYVGWSDLLRKFATKIGLKIKKEQSDLISLAQYYVNSKPNSDGLKQYVCKVFAPDKEKNINQNHILLSSLPFASYWTTNYDTLIEQSLENRDLKYNKIVEDKDLRKNENVNPIWLYKMHGDIKDYRSIVITKQDYENYYDKYEMLLAKLKSEICTKTFLFLGYSISDPNIMHILARARKVFDKENGRQHYAIMEKPKKLLSNGKNNRQYSYEKIKQQHQIADLAEYGIKVILVNDYSDITDILKAISGIVYKRNVLISGAFENETKNSEKLREFTEKLSAWLMTKEYRIFTGYGKNLGQHIVNGAFDGCKLKFRDDVFSQSIPDVVSINQRVVNNFNSNVFIFPFPYDKSMDENEREQLYRRLRENMIASTQITIIICGEKYSNGEDLSGGLINSQGVTEEYKISLMHGNCIIPLALTGGSADEIWNMLKNKNEGFYQSIEYQSLGAANNLDDLFNVLQNLINKLEEID